MKLQNGLQLMIVAMGMLTASNTIAASAEKKENDMLKEFFRIEHCQFNKNSDDLYRLMRRAYLIVTPATYQAFITAAPIRVDCDKTNNQSDMIMMKQEMKTTTPKTDLI